MYDRVFFFYQIPYNSCAKINSFIAKLICYVKQLFIKQIISLLKQGKNFGNF